MNHCPSSRSRALWSRFSSRVSLNISLCPHWSFMSAKKHPDSLTLLLQCFSGDGGLVMSRIVFLMICVSFRCLLVNYTSCHVPFTKKGLSFGTHRPDWWTVAEMEPYGRFSGPLTESSPPWLSPFSPVAQLRCLYAFPNPVQSAEFTTGGLRRSCRNISRMLSGNRMNLSLMERDGDTYCNQFFSFPHVEKMSLLSIRGSSTKRWTVSLVMRV